MAAEYPAMGHGTTSPQEGVDRQAKRKGRIGHSVTSSLLFGWLCARNSQEIFLLREPKGWFLKAITPVLVDVTRALKDLCRK